MADKKEYNTKQKNRLLSFFREHPDACFSAGDIIALDIAVSEATVYRCLSRLTAENKLKRFLPDKRGGALYQYHDGGTDADHYHLKCLKCGVILHLDCSFMLNMARHIASNHDFSVDNSQTTIYGVCKNCQ